MSTHALLSATRLISGLFLALCPAQGSVAEAQALGQRFQVNTNAEGGDQQRPDVAVAASGEFMVVWSSSTSAGSDSSQESIQARRFDAAGLPTGSEFQVNTFTTGGQVKPEVAFDASGNALVVWQSGPGIGGQRYDVSGAAVGGELAISSDPDIEWSPSVAVEGSGAAMVVWSSVGSGGTDQDGWSVQARRYDGTGAPIGGRFQVNTKTTGWQGAPRVSIAPDGSSVVVWNDDADFVKAQRYEASGSPAGGEFTVGELLGANLGTDDVTTVAHAATGEFVVAWPGDDPSPGFTILVQRFDASGSPLGSQLDVNAIGGFENPIPFHAHPDIAFRPSGDFVVSWDMRQYGFPIGFVYNQRYESDGTPVGLNFPIAPVETQFRRLPATVFDDNDNFIVVWDGETEPGSSIEIFGRRTRVPQLPSLGPLALIGLAALAMVAGVRSLQTRRRLAPKG